MDAFTNNQNKNNNTKELNVWVVIPCCAYWLFPLKKVKAQMDISISEKRDINVLWGEDTSLHLQEKGWYDHISGLAAFASHV